MSTVHATTLRQDIQQLRGIAVLAVIVNHLGVSWMPGGYLGVDMFFVVSGFVITMSMLSSTNGGVSRRGFFANFWVRRVFRLWPMLFVTVVGTTILLLVSGLATSGPLLTALASVLAVSNLRLLFGRLEYFALDTGADWFMHTWSLAVEEQIYIVLSIVFALVGLRRADSQPDRRVRALTVVIGLLVAASLVFAFLPSTTEVVRFYAPHTRFYQVGAGALLALIFARRNRPVVEIRSAFRTAILSVAAVGIALLFVLDPWNGRLVSLSTTVLTALIIALASGSHQTDGFLRGTWLGAIGDRSYALYLVHWPVQVLAVTVISSTYPRYAVSLVLTFVLGWLAYRWVENTTRHRWKPLRLRRAGAIAVTSMVITAGTVSLGYLRTEQRATVSASAVPTEKCVRENATVWVVGDSHLGSLDPEIAQAFGEDCAVIGNYGIVLDFVDLERSSSGQRSLRVKLIPTAWLIEQLRIAETPPRALIIVHFLSAFTADPGTAPASADFIATEWESSTGQTVSRDEFMRQLSNNLRDLAEAMAAHGGALVVTSPPPDFNWLSVDIDPALCTSRFIVSRECAIYRSESRISVVDHEARGGEIRRLLGDLERTNENFVHLPLDGPFCGEIYCSNFHDGEPVFLDDDHLNFSGGAMVGGFFDELAERLVISDDRDLRCIDGQSVYECRLVVEGGILGEYLLPPRFVTAPRTGVERSRVTHIDTNGSIHCISYWGTEEVSFVAGACGAD